MLFVGQRAKVCARNKVTNDPRDLFGVSVELIQGLDGPPMKIVKHHMKGLSGLVATMTRQEDEVRIPLKYNLSVQITPYRLTRKEIDNRIRAEARNTRNIDKGFDHFTGKFTREPVTMTVAIQVGFHGEYGWAVHLQQGKCRCLLKRQLVR